MVKLQKESAAACVLFPLIANTQLLISYFKLNLYTISVKSYKGQLGSRFDSYMVMADLALLEDLANHANAFSKSALIYLVRAENGFFCFLCHDFGEDVYIHMIKGVLSPYMVHWRRF